jgi:hypothetical protein
MVKSSEKEIFHVFLSWGMGLRSFSITTGKTSFSTFIWKKDGRPQPSTRPVNPRSMHAANNNPDMEMALKRAFIFASFAVR